MKKIFVFRELATSPYVFVRNDTVKGPLQPPYDGPFKVTQRNEKYFTIIVNSKNITVSIDRIKPAFMVSDNIEQQPQREDSAENRCVRIQPQAQSNRDEGRATRSEKNNEPSSGRSVRPPDRFRAG
jgi:hypothetical protein